MDIMPKFRQTEESLTKLVDTLHSEIEQDEYNKRPFRCKECLRFWEAIKLCSEALNQYNALLAATKRAFAQAEATQELYTILKTLEHNGGRMVEERETKIYTGRSMISHTSEKEFLETFRPFFMRTLRKLNMS